MLWIRAVAGTFAWVELLSWRDSRIGLHRWLAWEADRPEYQRPRLDRWQRVQVLLGCAGLVSLEWLVPLQRSIDWDRLFDWEWLFEWDQLFESERPFCLAGLFHLATLFYLDRLFFLEWLLF